MVADELIQPWWLALILAVLALVGAVLPTIINVASNRRAVRIAETVREENSTQHGASVEKMDEVLKAIVTHGEKIERTSGKVDALGQRIERVDEKMDVLGERTAILESRYGDEVAHGHRRKFSVEIEPLEEHRLRTEQPATEHQRPA